MKLKSILGRLGLARLFRQKRVVRNPAQLVEKLSKYWSAWLDGDYRTAFDMMLPIPEIQYEDWLRHLRLGENQPNAERYRLKSAYLFAISQCPDPNFADYYEVVARLRIQSAEGKTEEVLQTSVWSIDDSENWYPAMPVDAGD